MICNMHRMIFLSEYDLSFFAYYSDGRSILARASLLDSRVHIPLVLKILLKNLIGSLGFA